MWWERHKLVANIKRILKWSPCYWLNVLLCSRGTESRLSSILLVLCGF